MSNSIRFTLNGNPVEAKCRADMTVLEWLRGEALLRGTKEGCAEGDCGACSVLYWRPENTKDQSGYLPANSCILLMGQLEGGALLTVEGLANLNDGGHQIQQRMAENGSSQCGYCTPGIVVSLAGLLDRNTAPQESEVHDALAGNLCRCTGYKPIVEAAHTALKDSPEKLPAPASIAPEAEVGSEDSRMLLPSSLDELVALKAEHSDAPLLAGGTDLSIDVAHARARWPLILSTRDVAELKRVQENQNEIIIGGAVTWEKLLPHLERHYPSFATLVRRFGSVQIRSMGTVAGNIGTASPIGDGAPALLALGAQITLTSSSGSRTLPLEDYFVDYRKTVMQPDEVIEAVRLPLPAGNQQMRVYKISKRYDQDISTVCGAFSAHVEGGAISNVRIAYGGMAATPMRCTQAEAILEGASLGAPPMTEAKSAISNTFSPMTDMRGSSDYRAMVAQNLLERFFLDLAGNTIEVMAL